MLGSRGEQAVGDGVDEVALGGLAAFAYLSDIPRWRGQADDALDIADSLFLEQVARPDQADALEPRRQEMVAIARRRRSRRRPARRRRRPGRCGPRSAPAARRRR